MSLFAFHGFSDTHRFENPHSLQTLGFSLLSSAGGLVIDSDSELGSDPISEVRDRSVAGDGFTDPLRLHQLENHGAKNLAPNQLGIYLGILGSCLGMLGGFVHMTKATYNVFKKDESHLAESLKKNPPHRLRSIHHVYKECQNPQPPHYQVNSR